MNTNESVSSRLTRHLGQKPDTARALFVAANATIVGDVVLGPSSSVFYGAVLRGDIEKIRVGEGTNIQDNAVVHLADVQGAHIGAWCTIGHAAIVHACTIEDECLIGMGSLIMDDVIVEDQVMIGAGSLVAPGKILESGYLYVGRPAVQIRRLNPSELTHLKYSAEHYVRIKNNYRTV